jgi:hypothetical protein
VLQAALAHLDRWAGGGTPPPEAPRLELGGDASPLALDALGLAKGGLRSPWVDAPTAVLSGFGQTGSEFAFLFGTTRPFDAATRAPIQAAAPSSWRASSTPPTRRSRAATCSRRRRPRSVPWVSSRSGESARRQLPARPLPPPSRRAISRRGATWR